MKKLFSFLAALALAATLSAQVSIPWVDISNVPHTLAGMGINNGAALDSFASSSTLPALNLTGTAGAGFVTLPSQSSPPSAPASGNLRLYSDAANKFAWIGASGFTRSFDGTLTASRTFTLPDTSGTFLLDTATQTITNKSIAASEINSGAVGIGFGGTGATTAAGALNALFPSQSGAANKVAMSDGANINWSSNIGLLNNGGTAQHHSSVVDYYDNGTAFFSGSIEPRSGINPYPSNKAMRMAGINFPQYSDLSTATPGIFVLYGDSRFAGSTGTSPFATLSFNESFTTYNGAAGSNTIEDNIAELRGSIGLHYNAFSRWHIIVHLGGVNSKGNGDTPAQAFAAEVALANQAHALGFTFIVCTEIDNSVAGWTAWRGVSGSTDTSTYNGLINVYGSQYFDAVCDLASTANIGPPGSYSNTTYFVDGSHFATAGASAAAVTINASVNAWTARVFKPATFNVATSTPANDLSLTGGAGAGATLTVGQPTSRSLTLSPVASSQAAWGFVGARSHHATATYTDTSTANSGTAGAAVFDSVSRPTLAASHTGVTVSDAFTAWDDGPPIAGTNVTITNGWARGVNGNLKVFGGTLIGGGTAVPSGFYFEARNNSRLTTSTGGAAGAFDIYPANGGGANGLVAYMQNESGSPGITFNAKTAQNTTSTSTGAIVIASGGLGVSGAIFAGKPVVPMTTTVSGLPTASTYPGGIAYVTDATAPAVGVAPTGGGSAKAGVMSNGTTWTVYAVP